MTLPEMKELLSLNGIQFAGNISLVNARQLIIDNFGTEADAERTLAAHHAQNNSGGGNTNSPFANFMSFRQGGGTAGKIFNRPGTEGSNPYNAVEQELTGDVLAVELHNGPKGPINRIKVAVKGCSVGFVYSNKDFKVDDLVIVTCRVLSPGVYMDADKDGNQRELVVEAGRKAAYNITDIKMASVVRVQVAIALRQSAVAE